MFMAYYTDIECNGYVTLLNGISTFVGYLILK